MWRMRRQQSEPRKQGTESKALKQLQRNRKSFRYPEDGFAQKIEFSLLYTMLATPDTYPQKVINAMVEEEDFTEYIHTINGDVSYAQLSALLAFSAEINELNADSFSKREQEKTDTEDVSVSKKLCKKILRVVVQYAEKNNLDRGTELDDLLGSVKRVISKRVTKKEMKAILPFYIGYSVALLTANPLPLIIGAMGTANAAKSHVEIQNVEHIIAETDRLGDVETTGLLDEEEECSDYDD